MKYWEFLIQKEGDQTWLPLATQQVEILAGRYCIVAHTDRANTPLAIRLRPLSTENLPSHRRARQRTSQTNEAGLVVVMPYCYLEPGEWQLDCSRLNGLDDPAAGGWRYSLQLRVSARTEDLSGSHRSDMIVPVPIEDVADPSKLNGDLPLIQAQAEIWRQRQVANEPARSGPWRQPADESAYRVSLSQRAYLAQHSQPTTIIGKVNGLSKALDEAVPEKSELWIRLQNPQTAQVIMEAHRPLSLARLPADFKVQIQLPADGDAQVIVGEVSLRTAAAPDTPSQILSDQVFTITAGIDYLLAAIAYQDTSDFAEDSPLPETPAPLAETPNGFKPTVPLLLDPTRKDAAPAVGVLPPQLTRQEKAYSLAASQPELPAFRKPSNTVPLPSDSSDAGPLIVTQPAQFIGTSILDDDLEADEITAVLNSFGLDSIGLDSAGLDSTELEDEGSASLEAEAVEPPGISEDAPESFPASPASSLAEPSPADRQPPQPAHKADVDFQSLQLKSHFWQRLSMLTHESHREATKMAEGIKAAGVSREASFPLPAETALPLDDEVVIFDEPPATTSQLPAYQPPTHPATAYPATAEPLADSQPYPLARQPQSLMADEAPLEMPPPVISLPAGDLVAGELIAITVRTGPSSYRPFIKLWMIDRQSRSLVMEPQRLTNLLPDALGDLRAMVKLQVPLDCLDVQIGAIAIDMATQQESSKAVVNRRVVPADQSSPLRSFKL